MMMELLIGPIASGKSTWTARRAREGAIVLNDDSLVTSLHGGHYDLYDKKLKPVYKTIPLMMAGMAVLAGRDVVIDSTNLTRAVRGRWIGMAKMYDIPVVGVLFDRKSPAEHAGRRANADDRGHGFDYWLNVARYHDSIYEAPDVSEGMDNLVPIEVATEMLSEGVWSTTEGQS